jgi:hypothetical protein
MKSDNLIYELDLGEILKEYREAADSSLVDRKNKNWENRHNIWPGQSDDGRKWKGKLGRDPVPFDGASDSRVPLVDTYVNEDTDMLMTSLRSMTVQAMPTESNDANKAFQTTNFLRYMLSNQIEEFYAEAELAANYYLENGLAVIGVFWERETQRYYETIDLEDIKNAAMSDPALAELPSMLLDPANDDAVFVMAQNLLATQNFDVSDAEVRALISDLRKNGEGRVTVPMVHKDRPTVVALKVGEDFFAPPDTTDIQKARRLYYRQYMTAEQIQDAVVSQDWDKRWAEEIIERAKGSTTSSNNQNNGRLSRHGQRPGQLDLNTENLYEIVHAFERRVDPKTGVPGIYIIIFSPHLTSDESGGEIVAKHELLNYAHCRMPFVLMRREFLSRRVDDSRGYGEIAHTWQRQIKMEWDGRVDRSYLATMPPLLHPFGRAPSSWGPGVMVPRMRADDYQYAESPKHDAGSKEIEESIRKTADRYFGRPVDEANAAYAQMRQQNMVRKWLDYWREVAQQVLQLCQQFLPEPFYFRVVGSNQAEPLQTTRQEILGQYDITLAFNVSNLDSELVKQKLELLRAAVGEFDINGVVDRTELMKVVFDFVDPNMGERLLRPAEAASEQEKEEERNVFAQLMAGVPVDVKEGQAYQLRLTELGQLAQTPTAQKKLQEDEHVRGVVERRAKQLEHQLVQQQNAQIGRLGA